MNRSSALISTSLALLLVTACGDDGGTVDTASSTDPSTSTSASTGTETAMTEASTAVDSSTGADACATEQPTIVTDIDETLTLSDEEFFMQLQDGNYDPVERDNAAELITAYADLGYHIHYLTARSETFTVAVTDETAREATARWLDEHGFPDDPETTTLTLADGVLVGDAPRTYKADSIAEMQAMGYRYDYAYGNADTDIGAFEDGGIGKDVTFIIGELAGDMGTVEIMGEAWTDHLATHVPTVPEACPAQ